MSDQSRAVLVLVGLLCVAGIYVAFQIPIAIFPKTDFPRIIISVDDGEVPAEQMQASVTRIIEEAMNGMPGILNIRSTTARGSAEINLFFDWNVDIVQSLHLVQERLSQMSSKLPPTAEIKSVDRLTFAVFPVAGYSLTSKTRDPAALRDVAEYTIRPRLARLRGVGDVAVSGGKTREYRVIVDPEALQARAVSLQQVVNSIQNTNVTESPGLIDENHHLELALVSGRATKSDDLKKIVVSSDGSSPVLLRDVAEIRESVQPDYTILTADGQPAVLINILRQPDANTVSVVDRVKAELASIRSQLPGDVKVAPFYDQSILVRDSIYSVRDAIMIGLLLSVLILYGFLLDWGVTFVAVLVIPTTVLITILAMRLAGLSFDLMTLGGIAASIGLVIDNAIVVVENIFTHAARGGPRDEAIHAAVAEITAPVVGSTVTPVVVFLPMALLTGVTGVFFRSLALTMAVALIVSLVLALGVTPVLAGFFLKHGKREQDAAAQPDAEEKAPENHSTGRLLGVVIEAYERKLNSALARPYVVILACVALVGVSYIFYRGLGSEFLPAFDESAFVLDYVAPPGTSLGETDRILRHVERILKSTPEVESFSRRTGLQLGMAGVTEPNTGDFAVKLKPGHARTTEEVKDALRQEIESSEPALRVEFLGILSDLIGDLSSAPSPIEIKLFSEDTAALHRKAAEVARAIHKVPGIVDEFDGLVISGPAVTFNIDAGRAAKFGVSTRDIADTVTTAMSGAEASQILTRGRLIPVRVTLPDSARASLDSLKALPIRSEATGALFRLDQVADVAYESGQTEIVRDGLRQSVAVTARLSGSDLGSAMRAVQAVIAKNISLPPGMTVEYGGLYQEQQSSFHELLIALLLAVVLVFFTLLVEFKSFAYPVAIMVGSVLSLSGVLAALLVTGMTLNVVSLVGLIMIVGIVAKNGILMLDSVDDHLSSGAGLRVALMNAGRRRFRPVLMTSLATILGMLPLALAIGSGAELLQPLAIAVIGGLVLALPLSLIVTPTIYAVLKKK